MMKKIVSLLCVGLIAIVLYSCGNKTYDEMTPEEQQKEYAQFQKDSVKICTENKYLAKTLILEAFDRDVVYSKKYNKEKETVVFNDELQGWVGTINYHVSNGNVFTEGTKVYHLFIWYENNGLAKDGKIFYKVSQVSGDR